jgi:hypothetical protein
MMVGDGSGKRNQSLFYHLPIHMYLYTDRLIAKDHEYSTMAAVLLPPASAPIVLCHEFVYDHVSMVKMIVRSHRNWPHHISR